MSSPIIILKNLLQYPSITPKDAGAFSFLEEFCNQLGGISQRITFQEKGTEDVENFYASIGHGEKHLLFAGHIDVVPPGDRKLWRFDPFTPTEENGYIFGRGAVDMKGGIACFLAAIKRYLQNPENKGRISLAITADEEGPAINGTVKLMQWLQQKGEKFHAAIVGEPTCQNEIGDMIKIGRRGSLSATLTITGIQGHVAYPQNASNPLSAIAMLIQELEKNPLDKGSQSFPPSHLEFTTIDSNNPTTNLIPAHVKATFNIRYNDYWTAATLQKEIKDKIDNILQLYQQKTNKLIKHEIIWQKNPAEAFLTKNEKLITAMKNAIQINCNLKPELSTSGGTSDARFIKNYCPVIEFGLTNKTMHQANEAVPNADLEKLTNIYETFLKNFFQ